MVWGVGWEGEGGIEMDYSDLPALGNNPQTEQTYVKYERFEDLKKVKNKFLFFFLFFFPSIFSSRSKAGFHRFAENEANTCNIW